MKKFFTLFLTVVLGTMVLFADNEPALPLIAIDGDFEDWGALNPASFASASTNENAVYKSLYNIKFTSDANYIYFYFEFSSGTYEAIDHSIGDDVMEFEIMLDVDGDVSTGLNAWQWNPSGVDYMISTTVVNQFEDAALYTHTTGWNWYPTGAYEFFLTSAVQTLGNGHYALEGSIKRSWLPIMQSLKVGVMTANTHWSASGVLPQISFNLEGGSDILQPMLNVPLYQDPSSIMNTASVQGCKPQKLLRNGNVYILTEDKTYTLTGQEVK